MYSQYTPLLKSAFLNLRSWLPGFSEAAFYRYAGKSKQTDDITASGSTVIEGEQLIETIKSSDNQLACLLSVTPTQIQVYDEPFVIHDSPMTPR